jgi:putative pyruvate formate lyase activating enzyme
MPDMKFTDSRYAQSYCKAPDYPDVVGKALKEMHRQVGDLEINENGRAEKGLLVRHLVMPDNRAGTKEAMRFLASEISIHTYVNIMDQYHPSGNIADFPELQRPTTDEEFQEALDTARAEGLLRLDNRQRGFLLHWR